MSAVDGTRLRLRRLEPPAGGRVFAGWELACQHLCDHLLTPPEMQAWARWLPPLRPLLGQEQARFRLARAMWRDQGRSAQPLYDALCDLLSRVLHNAQAAGWTWRQQRRPDLEDSCWFSAHAVLLVQGPHLRTAYIPLPGGSGEQPAASLTELVAERLRSPLPRQGGPTAGPGEGNDRGARIAAFRTFRRAATELRHRWVGRRRPAMTDAAMQGLREASRDVSRWEQALGEEQAALAGDAAWGHPA